MYQLSDIAKIRLQFYNSVVERLSNVLEEASVIWDKRYEDVCCKKNTQRCEEPVSASSFLSARILISFHFHGLFYRCARSKAVITDAVLLKAAILETSDASREPTATSEVKSN